MILPIHWNKQTLRSYLKKLSNQLCYFLLLSILLNACQSRHYSHLNKVRVKSKLKEKTAGKHPKIKEEKPIISKPKALETASIETKKEFVPIQNDFDSLTQSYTETRNPKQESKIALEKLVESSPTITQKEPVTPKQNITAFVAANLGVLSLLAIAADLFLIELGTPSIIAFGMAIPILILGFIGLNNYKKKRAKNGKGWAIFSIVVGFTLIALFLALLIFIILFIFSGGYGAND